MLNAVLQRRELARRRALGHARSHILAALLIEAALLSLLGATAGVVAAQALFLSRGQPLALGQPSATIGVITFIATFAALPGGLAAAFQDPARILRVPGGVSR